MTSTVGRQANVCESEWIPCILKRKGEIFKENGKLMSKKDKVWQNLSDDLGGKWSAITCYNKLCNKNIRSKLGLPQNEDEKKDTNITDNNSSFSEEINSDDEDDIFKIFANKKTFENLFVEKEYKQKIVKNQEKDMETRTCLRLESGRWEDWISEEIYSLTKIVCGFNFRGHYKISSFIIISPVNFLINFKFI